MRSDDFGGVRTLPAHNLARQCPRICQTPRPGEVWFDEIVQRGYKSGMSSPSVSSFSSEGGTRLRLLNVKEVAKRLDLSLPRVYELARGGILPVVRLGRQIRVDESRLIAWINDGGRASPLELPRLRVPDESFASRIGDSLPDQVDALAALE
jgi:excisionase family DNA binding protein